MICCLKSECRTRECCRVTRITSLRLLSTGHCQSRAGRSLLETAGRRHLRICFKSAGDNLTCYSGAFGRFGLFASATAFGRRSFSTPPTDDFLNGTNTQYVEDLFAKWTEDPESVDNSWASFFTSGDFLHPKADSSMKMKVPTHIPRIGGGDTSEPFDLTSPEAKRAVSDAVSVVKLARAYAQYGHFMAKLDPLKILDQGIDRKQFVPELLSADYWGFKTDADLDRAIYVGAHSEFLALTGSQRGWVTVRNVVSRLRAVYCSSIGHQYMHIANSTKNQFLRQMIERDTGITEMVEKKRILDRLLWAELFEKVFDKKYPAQKRFGVVGAESMVPLLKEIIDEGARQGIEEFVIGMPHRGRLITLTSVLRKPLERIFHEFRGRATPDSDISESGDVKYHLGYSTVRNTPDEIKVRLSLFPNPSHLEAVNSVVMGKVRAKQYFQGDSERKKVCALLMHGDASFCGQGNVYESMALTDLYDYCTGGVIHVIVNNQIGFTTSSYNARSSPYCTDVARSIAAPIWHVNGDDAEAVVRTAKMAVRFRQNFGSDAVLDMVCYRRYGHNEGDNPVFTHPYMYKVIEDKVKAKETVCDLYTRQLLEEGVVSETEVAAMASHIEATIQEAYAVSETLSSAAPDWLGGNWSQMVGPNSQGIETPTCISKETALQIADAMTELPKGFKAHRTVAGIMKKRSAAIHSEQGIDWGTGEALAFGSLLLEGIDLRISGQDSERGTFSHRHAVLHEQQSVGAKQRPTYVPLANLKGRTGGFRICNSNLSELAVLGFEYGVSSEHPNQLVIWEAQFGDFANGAQVIFDQFVSSAESKWLKQSALVLLLPHGYEGGGPEHSSARMERYLVMCSDDDSELQLDAVKASQRINWQAVNCTTPANMFHAFRRQLHRNFRKPLLVFSPKTGLKHKYCVSKLKDFTEGSFQRVIAEDWAHLPAGVCPKPDHEIRRLVFCSGKLWIHLMDERAKKGLEKEDTYDNVGIVRLEQLAPFPYDLVRAQMERYPNAELMWAMEEPKNMGAWMYVCPRFDTAQSEWPTQRKLTLVSRKAAAAPATGYPTVDAKERNAIVQAVFAK